MLNRKGMVVAAGAFVAVNLVLLRAGCATTETTTPSTRPPTSSSAPSASPRASITFTGDVGLTGAGSDPSVRCNFPVLEGMSIAVLAKPQNSTVLARVGLQSGKVKVFVGSGSGPDYHERAFEGTGVTSFDAAKGAVIDSTLTETAATAGSAKGTVGALTAIRGSVECGDQTAGTSTVTITGNTAEGALVAIGLSSDGAVSVDETLPSGLHRYRASGSSTITSTGAHVRADVVEQGVATPAHTLHVEGDLSCGLHAAG